jgi:hypothetical protein
MDAVVAMRDEIGACVPAFIVTGDTSKIDVDSLANSRMMNKPVEPGQLLSLASAALATGHA